MAETRRVRVGNPAGTREITVSVPPSEPRIWDADARLEVVGSTVPRLDGADKVTGRARFTYDINLEGMLHARVLRSPHPHARILSIDASEAKRLAGVRAAITFEGADPFSSLGRKDEAGRAVEGEGRTGSPSGERRRVLFAGEEVAAVAAVTPELAEDALDLIRVEYEALPHVTDPEQARRRDAPRVFPEGNVAPASVRERGDVGAGFREAAVTVEGTYGTPVALHNSLESHGAVARWQRGKLTVWASTQGVFGFRDDLAKFFGIPSGDVRVVSEYLGGGFGSKFGAQSTGVIAALLSRAARAPVKLMLDRHEENLATGNRPSSTQWIRVGARRDGTLTAVHLKSYGTAGIATGAGVGGPAWKIYACPNVRIEEEDVYTNAGPAAPFRAPGYPQGSFALESALDELSDRLGLDPLSLRLRNYVDKPAKALRLEYELAAKEIGWERRRSPRRGAGGVRRGMGMGTALWPMYGGPPADATVTIHSDGTVECVCGTQAIGGGTRTAMAMVVAEVLGLKPGDIRATIGDTGSNMYAGASGGSTTLTSILPAVRTAAEGAKARFLEAVAPSLGGEPGELELRDRRVKTADGGRSVPFREAAGRLGSSLISAQASRARNFEGLGIESYGAQFAEVEVDTATGRVRVLKIAAAHDCGRTINRLTAESQVNGGVIMGLSYALLEQRVIDHPTGIVVNPNLEAYKIAGTMETPEIVPILVEVHDPANNVGAKGLGEPPIVPTAAAIANAVSNALGARVRELPITPARVLSLLGGGEA
ncbi:MAG: xanthine dehydrogenase family protein molybdopterin-binding subunit [Acidobacteriota bacterium]